MAGNMFNLSIDISDVQQKAEMLKLLLSEKNFRRMMATTFRETGRHVKRIVQTDLPHEYEAKPRWIGSQVQKPQMGAGGMSCTIPISGTRGILGEQFEVVGGSNRKRKPKKGQRKIIHAKVVKGQRSTLPPLMESYYKQPPFRVGKKAYTRVHEGQAYPIVPIAGIGVPQMPLNRSQTEVENDVVKFMEKRLEQNFKFFSK